MHGKTITHCTPYISSHNTQSIWKKCWLWTWSFPCVYLQQDLEYVISQSYHIVISWYFKLSFWNAKSNDVWHWFNVADYFSPLTLTFYMALKVKFHAWNWICSLERFEVTQVEGYTTGKGQKAWLLFKKGVSAMWLNSYSHVSLSDSDSYLRQNCRLL